MYNYHCQVSELLSDGYSYEEACALCEFVFGDETGKENTVHMSRMAMKFKNNPRRNGNENFNSQQVRQGTSHVVRN